MVVRILVSTASKHGSTGEIATRIAEALRAGLPGAAVVDVLPAAEVGDATSYDAVVLGSAVYMGRWLEDARHAATRLATHPPRPVQRSSSTASVAAYCAGLTRRAWSSTPALCHTLRRASARNRRLAMRFAGRSR